jgi:protein arginine N-methyltransferase 1
MEPPLQHHEYLADRAKLASYEAAINACVTTDHVVVDLGCGTGVLGLMALEAGAKKAVFIDHGSVIEVARRTVTDAGFVNQSEFIEASSFEVELPERADVVVCDHVGYFGFDYGVLELFADARRRFLKPGGLLLPRSLDLWLAPVESDECRQSIDRWKDGSIPSRYRWMSETAANTKHSAQLVSDELLADAAKLTTLELGEEPSDFHSWTATFECARNGSLDGLAGWFDACLYDDIRMTNSPLASDRLTRPQAFLPLGESVEVRTGDKIDASVMVRPEDNIIAWVIELPASGQRFALNTFNGMTLDKATIDRVQPNRLAKINKHGRARQIVLSYCDGKRTVGEVQQLVLANHPDLFPSAIATRDFINRVLSCDTSA